LENISVNKALTIYPQPGHMSTYLIGIKYFPETMNYSRNKNYSIADSRQWSMLVISATQEVEANPSKTSK
jgi:hypothetical protein